MPRTSIASLIIILAVAAGMLLTAPTDGSFWWSEAPRNALNGAFVLDFLKEQPFDDPIQWAEAYYYQYPSLTVLFYPPLFHATLALAYAIFGVSHFTAVLTVMVFYLILMIGAFCLGARLTGPLGGLALVLLFAGAPEVAIWGRQVMLEIPMMAFAVWSSLFVLKFIESNHNADLSLAIFFALCAIYTKQTIVYLFLIFAVVILFLRWRDFLQDRRKWVIVLFAVAGVVPLIVMQLKFGAFNLTSVVERDDMEVGRWSIESWSWYLSRLPSTIGWPATIAAALTPMALIGRFENANIKSAVILLTAWALGSYLFFSLVSLKETRHGIPLYFSITALGVFSLYRLLGTKIGSVLAIAAGAFTVISTWIWVPTPALSGYRASADLIVDEAKPNARVMFVGNRDGHFVYNIRANSERQDLTVVRADKLLLNVKIMPSLGYGEKPLDQAEISEMLNRYGIEWVVTVDDFWTHLSVMQELSELLAGPQFEEFHRVQVIGNIPHKDKTLIIYRNLGDLLDPPEDYIINLGAIERKIGTSPDQNER